MPCSPWRRIRLASIAAGLMADRSGWIKLATDSLTPATGARTTRFYRTLQRRSSCAPCPLTGKPALRTRIAPDAAASTASRPAFVTTRDPPLLSRRDSAEKATDLGARESEIFLRWRRDDPNRPEIIQQIAVCAQRYWEPFGRRACRETKARVQVVVRQARCMYVRISDDLSKAEPIALRPRRPASLQFFLADHDRVAGVRCQS